MMGVFLLNPVHFARHRLSLNARMKIKEDTYGKDFNHNSG